jgi:hypothetical protein
LARRLPQSLALLILLAGPPAAAEEPRWLAVLFDGALLAGPGAFASQGQTWMPLTLLARRLGTRASYNAARKVVLVRGWEYPVTAQVRQGIVFVPLGEVRRLFPELLVREGEASVEVWTPARASQAADSQAPPLLLTSAEPRPEGQGLVLVCRVRSTAGRQISGAEVVVTLRRPDGRTYAVFRQPVGPLEPLQESQVRVPLWLTPARPGDPGHLVVQTHGFGGRAPGQEDLLWEATVTAEP